jgi:L-2-hydroxyglutarate oxidase LhgO
LGEVATLSCEKKMGLSEKCGFVERKRSDANAGTIRAGTRTPGKVRSFRTGTEANMVEKISSINGSESYHREINPTVQGSQ